MGPHHEGVSAWARLEQPRAVIVAAATSASLCLAENFIVASHQSWFALFDHACRPPDRVDADAKTQGQSLDDGLSRVGNADGERELAQLVQEKCSDDGGDRKTPSPKQRCAAEDNDRHG